MATRSAASRSAPGSRPSRGASAISPDAAHVYVTGSSDLSHVIYETAKLSVAGRPAVAAGRVAVKLRCRGVAGQTCRGDEVLTYRGKTIARRTLAISAGTTGRPR